METIINTQDEARVQCPLPKVKPSVEAKKFSASNPPPSADMLRESIKFLEEKHPTSPMLTAQKKQLEALESK